MTESPPHRAERGELLQHACRLVTGQRPRQVDLLKFRQALQLYEPFLADEQVVQQQGLEPGQLADVRHPLVIDLCRVVLARKPERPQRSETNKVSEPVVGNSAAAELEMAEGRDLPAGHKSLVGDRGVIEQHRLQIRE